MPNPTRRRDRRSSEAVAARFVHENRHLLPKEIRAAVQIISADLLRARDRTWLRMLKVALKPADYRWVANESKSWERAR